MKCDRSSGIDRRALVSGLALLPAVSGALFRTTFSADGFGTRASAAVGTGIASAALGKPAEKQIEYLAIARANVASIERPS
jgi:hypothetical protein